MTETDKRERELIKEEWLNQSIFVDTYGRPYNASDVPMTYMTRAESFEKRGLTDKEINELWKKGEKLWQKQKKKVIS